MKELKISDMEQVNGGGIFDYLKKSAGKLLKEVKEKYKQIATCK